MDVEQFKEDVRAGRITTDRLVGLVVSLLDALQAAKKRIDELERQLGGSLPPSHSFTKSFTKGSTVYKKSD